LGKGTHAEFLIIPGGREIAKIVQQAPRPFLSRVVYLRGSEALSVVPKDAWTMTTVSRRSKIRFRQASPARVSAGRAASRTPLRATGLASRLQQFVREIARPGRRADVFAALMRAMNTTRVPDRMAGHILDLSTVWFGGEAWAMLSVHEGRGLERLADRGVSPWRRAMIATAAERAVHGGRITWSSEADPAGPGRGAGWTSLVAIPVKNHGRPVAVLVGIESHADAPAADRWPDARSLAPIVELAGSMAGAFDTAMRLKRANALSTTDDLTGLYNSRFLNGALRREVKRSVRTGRPLSLLFVDLDGFKGVNDHYGHLYGSRALVEAAGRIQSAARETDVVARFGGDEFALILPDTGREGAMLVARRVRDRVAGLPFLAAAGFNYPLTASVGAATLPPGGGTPEALLAAADTAMYRVKGRGKNGFEMADVIPPSQQL
jgi:diguanylate cyclase (GGDEF)-like protein